MIKAIQGQKADELIFNWNKNELYDFAKEMKIEGRSRMNKAQLAMAIEDAMAAAELEKEAAAFVEKPMMKKYQVVIRKHTTEEIVQMMEPTKNLKKALQIVKGADINLNHAEYYLEIAPISCPRCESGELHPDEVMNALSKDNETYICNDCAWKETQADLAALDLMDAPEMDAKLQERLKIVMVYRTIPSFEKDAEADAKLNEMGFITIHRNNATITNKGAAEVNARGLLK